MNKAFTLIELLVVVLIIGILSAVALPQYQKAVLKTRFTQLVVLQDTLRRAEQVYWLANNRYTSKFEELDVQMPAGTSNYDENENRSHWDDGKYSLTLSLDWSQGYYQGLSYVVYHNGARECRVYDNSEMKKGVCLSMGGVAASCSSCNYTAYNL